MRRARDGAVDQGQLSDIVLVNHSEDGLFVMAVRVGVNEVLLSGADLDVEAVVGDIL